MMFKNISYVIIDETPMLSCHNFEIVHKRLCENEVTTHDATVLFGGLSMIMFAKTCARYLHILYGKLSVAEI